MIEFSREQIKADPEVMRKLLAHIIKNHKVAPHTQKTLFSNRHVKDFCEEARHFAIMQAHGRPSILLHYDIS